MLGLRPPVAAAFVLLFVLYQSAEGVGLRLLHSFPVQAALMAACVLAAWPLSRRLGYRGYRAYALEAGPRWWLWLPGGLALAALAKGMAVAAGLRMGVYTAISPDAPPAWSALLATAPMLLLSTFVPSLAEDILTRGFWYRAAGIPWRRGVWFVAFSAAVFVLNHVYRLGKGPLEWWMLCCFGTAYATALWRSGSLWGAVGLHWGWNLANGALDLLWPVGLLDATMSPLLSAAAHLLMTLVVLLVPTGSVRRE
ncbi:CPBP family intramembrane glutamic endopeptidase [Frateuria defendens]|uniref:CPBP family intramembrane glutamic endopeptidase n=1 Tax=Frateuria defendens TaxID=2219559 RepID=UPI00066FF28C|nr:CPBP family intramembrane glutamic endopeptidase [Frateuria defendens]